MKKVNIYFLAMLFVSLCFVVKAQPISTKITKFTIDNKVVKKDYEVFLYSKGKELKAERTKEGFVVPEKLKDQKTIDIRIIFGKYILDFVEIPISKFQLDWRVGIDNKPLSNGRIDSSEAKKVKFVYFLQYGGTELIVQVMK